MFGGPMALQSLPGDCGSPDPPTGPKKVVYCCPPEGPKRIDSHPKCRNPNL